MDILIVKVKAINSESSVDEVCARLSEAGIKAQKLIVSDETRESQVLGPISVSTFQVPVPSIKDSFQIIYKVVRQVFTMNGSHQISFEYNGKKVTISGHSFPEEMEILKILLPELMNN